VTVTTNTSVTALSASVSPAGMFTISGETTDTITVTPVADANGSATLTVVGTDSVLGGTFTTNIVITVRPPLLITTAIGDQSFAEKSTCPVNWVVSSCYDCDESNVTYVFDEPYAPWYNIIDPAPGMSHTLGTAGTNNFTTTFATAELYAYGGPVPSLAIVSVGPGDMYVKTNSFSLTVTAVPDPPLITGLPREIIISSRDPYGAYFRNASITDPDDWPPPPPDPAYTGTAPWG
jgi:hypothetical protein